MQKIKLKEILIAIVILVCVLTAIEVIRLHGKNMLLAAEEKRGTSRNSNVEINKITTEIKDNTEKTYILSNKIRVWEGAKYTTVGYENYPQTDPKNGYAKSYIYAAQKYIKSTTGNTKVSEDDVQQALYNILGEDSSKDSVSTLAKEYQKYKQTEEDLTIRKTDKTKEFIDGEKLLYGPLQIEYSYLKVIDDLLYDEWGGFIYALFDENGNNVSSKVKLYILENGEYKEIKSTKVTSNNDFNGYYKVKTNKYNKVNIYIGTTDKSLTKVYLKARANIEEYKAQTHKEEGEFNSSTRRKNILL